MHEYCWRGCTAYIRTYPRPPWEAGCSFPSMLVQFLRETILLSLIISSNIEYAYLIHPSYNCFSTLPSSASVSLPTESLPEMRDHTDLMDRFTFCMIDERRSRNIYASSSYRSFEREGGRAACGPWRTNTNRHV